MISGASRGLGRRWAQTVLEHGDRVAATARDAASLAPLAERYGDNVLPLGFDVTDPEAVREAVRTAVSPCSASRQPPRRPATAARSCAPTATSWAASRVLERLLKLPGRPRRVLRPMNLAMHYGQGVLLGTLRGVMANVGLRGVWASAMLFVVWLTNDQILENATSVRAPPETWPRAELAADLLHITVYGFAASAFRARFPAGPQRSR
jgi:hypothetical protein